MNKALSILLSPESMFNDSYQGKGERQETDALMKLTKTRLQARPGKAAIMATSLKDYKSGENKI
jgi:hypothetical protein